MAHFVHASDSRASLDLCENIRILIVGTPKEQVHVARMFNREFDHRCADFASVTAMLREIDPHVVLSPVLSDHFDCFDLADVLIAEGFQGQYRGIGEFLPQPSVVRTEVRSLFPEVDFDIVMLPASARARLS